MGRKESLVAESRILFKIEDINVSEEFHPKSLFCFVVLKAMKVLLNFYGIIRTYVERGKNRQSTADRFP